jgi:hypothetical protein
MRKYAQGKYTPLNKDKYVGNKQPTYRSGWELAFMRFCDNNNNVLQWASESIQIPYRNPITGKQSIYVPDFFITYRDKRNTMKAELIEIKPRKQSVIEGRMSEQQRAVVAVNYAKWDAAQKWCKRQGVTFRVVTEDDMFRK